MNILLLGSGGREHAIGWKLLQSPKVKNLFIAPGNAGTSSIGKNIPLSPNDFHSYYRDSRSAGIACRQFLQPTMTLWFVSLFFGLSGLPFHC